MCTGCSDVWSAVRSACVARLPTILAGLSLANLASLYARLFTVRESRLGARDVLALALILLPSPV